MNPRTPLSLRQAETPKYREEGENIPYIRSASPWENNPSAPITCVLKEGFIKETSDGGRRSTR